MRPAALLAALAALLTPAALAETGPARLTIDDVLDTQRIDHAALSPDGEWVAAVVQRPARNGEVYGRTAYEIDPSRNDVWLISTRTGERRALTDGAAEAAGFWCATWSPDGRRLALLSTRPEGSEPRGGDNVRLYAWDRDADALARVSDDAIMTQTRYGSGLDELDLRGGADRSAMAHSCNGRDENAPFVWLDDHRLLTVMLPEGRVSGLLDQYGRPFRIAARDARRLREGAEPTVSAVGSGQADLTGSDRDKAILRIVDLRARTTRDIATVPTYPFRGTLTLAVSPDGERLALLATLGALHPQASQRFPNSWDDAWTVERRLGFVDLAPGAPIRWVTMPAAGRYPLELYGWSPDSRRVALRGRADPFAERTPLFAVLADTGAVTPLGTVSVGEAVAGPATVHEPAAIWADDRRLVVRVEREGPDAPEGGWKLFDLDGRETNLTRPTGPVPRSFRRSADGGLVTVAGDTLFRLDAANAALKPMRVLKARRRSSCRRMSGGPPIGCLSCFWAEPGTAVWRRFRPARVPWVPSSVPQTPIFWTSISRMTGFCSAKAIATASSCGR